ncbi:MAG: cysteine--tRNA ligase [Bacteroidetes bacterium]|nr:cysteine--tRNA ligase [Bacteroidota bacterium]
MSDLHLYNTYTRNIEKFESIQPNYVGMYVCGPTVYGPPHIGHVRGPIVFDVLRRYMMHLGYRVRYVRNITDVGHLVGDVDEGEDKLAVQARKEQVEPMEIAQSYTLAYNDAMRFMNVIPPAIEPRASGHIIEQIEMISEIIQNGFAYEVNGSVYFDVLHFNKSYDYGKLSGRILEDLMAGAGNESRELEGQEEKRNANDFALWKKASPEHLMQWSSPWGKGYPGWHIECSAMSKKYLGEVFDIHGGGMDLLFPHHTGEIAQSTACSGNNPAKYWVHHNMITINGQKMAKSLNNGIKVLELFSGEHPLLEQAYSPMTLRFFILQAHYRGTLDFSNEALKASEKGLQRLFNAAKLVHQLAVSDKNDFDIAEIENEIYNSLNDDLNTPQAIAQLFEAARIVNIIHDKKGTINAENLAKLQQIFQVVFSEILGILEESSESHDAWNGVMKLVLDIRQQAKTDKNFALSDSIRKNLEALGFEIKDGKEGSIWNKN